MIILVLAACGINIILIFSRLKLKQPLKKNIALQRYRQAEEDLKRDLEEKYRADLISYQVMVKRLELEKNKQKELKKGSVKPNLKD